MDQTRRTRQRELILETLRSVTSHPTADEIYGMVREKMPRISMGTVYRNLDLLTHSGEIRCLVHAGLQKRFDGNPEQHWHVRCRSCGRLGDARAACAFHPHAPGDVTADGFTIESMTMEFTGLCGSCRNGDT